MIAEILHKLAGQFDQEDSKYYPRPSLAGPDRCIRQMVYWGLDYRKEPLPGRTFYIFDDGNWHEELTLDWIRKSAFQVHSQQMKIRATFAGLTLTGSIDGILTDPLGQDFLFEHKGLSHFSWQRYAGGELPMDYLTQVGIYLYGIRADQPDLRKFVLLLKNKNTSAYLEITGHLDSPTLSLWVTEMVDSNGTRTEINKEFPTLIADAFHKFNEVNDRVKTRTLPKRPYDMDDWHCDYCGYAKTCWKDYAAEFDQLATDAELPSDVADMVAYRQQVAAQRLEMEKEEDTLTSKIKAVLKDSGVREGRAGEYIVRLSLRERNSLDKTLIPPGILEQAKKISQYEQLSIRKFKEAKK